MEKPTLSLTQIADDEMQVQIVGQKDLLMAMIYSALMKHKAVRDLLMPVVMQVMKDPEFLQASLEDMANSLRDESKDASEDILTTD